MRYGEPIDISNKDDIDAKALQGGLKVKVLEGPTAIQARPTGQEDEVKSLLGPLVPAEVPLVRCIGLNYKTHSRFFSLLVFPMTFGTIILWISSYFEISIMPKMTLLTYAAVLETGFDLPENPTVFFKSSETVADTRAATPIPKLGQKTCDYEGELTIVIGKDARDVSPADALDYVAGYVSGNDVSCRDWQMEKSKAGMMPQWCFSKSFDKYAPLGPAIVSPAILGDAKGLELVTRVNGEERQRTNTDDLCFGVREIVSFCSTGQTLKAGSLIMTGTPSGVCLAMKPEPKYLQDGDEVSVEISGIGKVVTTMKFE